MTDRKKEAKDNRQEQRNGASKKEGEKERGGITEGSTEGRSRQQVHNSKKGK